MVYANDFGTVRFPNLICGYTTILNLDTVELVLSYKLKNALSTYELSKYSKLLEMK